jgi:hypothetical protein
MFVYPFGSFSHGLQQLIAISGEETGAVGNFLAGAAYILAINMKKRHTGTQGDFNN